MSESKPSTAAKLAGLLLTFFVLIPVSALLITWAAGLLWSWHLEPQYGPGPKPIAWYGIAMLVFLIVREKRVDGEAEKAPVLAPIRTLAHTAAFTAVTLASSCFVRALFWN